jgi:hypothetical protein
MIATTTHIGHSGVLSGGGRGRVMYEMNIITTQRRIWNFTLLPPPLAELLEIHE